MIKKLLFVSIAASGIGLYMSKGKIEFEGTFQNLYSSVYKISPKYANVMLGKMLRHRMFKPRPSKPDKPKAVDEGFDLGGNLALGLFDLGFNYVIVGPGSFNFNSDQTVVQNEKNQEVNDRYVFGIRGIRANLQQLKNQRYNKQIHQIGVSIIPSKQVNLYSPYLFETEICKSIKEIARSVDFIVLNFTHDQMSVLDTFLKNTVLVDSFLQNCSLESLRASSKIEKKAPKIFIRIDEKDLTSHLKNHPLINGFIFKTGCQEKPSSKLVFGPAGNKFSDIQLIKLGSPASVESL